MWNRRDMLRWSSVWAGATWLAVPDIWAWQAEASGADSPPLEMATFRVDVTPPVGHPLCGGWIQPVVAQDDGLEAIGVVLFGAGQPIVWCAVDWTGLLNQSHIAWRQRIAEAVGTSADRVAVHCVHQHNAPFVCLDAQQICAQYEGLSSAIVDREFFAQTLDRVAQAVKEASERRRAVTQVATSAARVERVASNRRFLGPDGKIVDWRGSSSKNPVHKELPEGLIDPELKTIAFYSGNERLAACHYYATHPMSYYGDGRVTSDFVGLARKRVQADEPGCTHLYFTGCSGNIAPGKYNDGTPTARQELTDRMEDALRRSVAALQPQAIERVAWQTQDVLPEPRKDLVEDELLALVANPEGSLAQRIRPSMMVSWLRRCRNEIPITLAALHVNEATVVHLPSEAFVEYQLALQAEFPQRFVATAAYGDGGPWYIPTRECYPQGGYEVDVAFCEPTIDQALRAGWSRLRS